MTDKNAGPGQSLISRVVAILGTFAGDRTELTMSEIARATALPTSTVHRIVHALVEDHALEKLPNGSYVIGLSLWGIASRTPHSFSLTEAAMPYLQHLLHATRQHVHLATMHDGQAIILEKLSWPGTELQISRAGRILPLHASATGLILLAYAEPEVQQEILAAPLTSYTEKTETDPAVLRARLAEIRQNGRARVVGELVPTLNSCAAPVFWRDRSLAGSLGVVVEEDGPELRRIEQLVWTAAARLTAYLASPQADAAPQDLFKPLKPSPTQSKPETR